MFYVGLDGGRERGSSLFYLALFATRIFNLLPTGHINENNMANICVMAFGFDAITGFCVNKTPFTPRLNFGTMI